MEGSVIEPVISKAQKLRWFHLMSTGVESLMFPAIRDSNVVLTNARGVSAIPISESVMAVILYAAKNLGSNFANNRQRIWERVPRVELNGQTAGIIGLGKIGNEIARKLKCFGMQIIGIKRRPWLEPSTIVDEVFGTDKLHELLIRSDWVIVSAPLTKQTKHLFADDEFRMMKPTAWYVTIARGEIADEQALIRAIDSRLDSWSMSGCVHK